MDLLSAPRGELLRLVYELIDENQSLKTQIAELRSRLSEKGDDGGKKTPPSFVKPNRKPKEIKQRKKREQNFARGKDIPTQQVFHSFDVCPDCGSSLGKPAVSYTRQVIDIIQPQISVTEHVICKRWCFKCQKRVTPKVNLSSLTVGHQRVGINLTSYIATLRERLRLPVGVIQLYLSLFCNWHLSKGEIIALLQKVSLLGKSDYQKIQDQVLLSTSVCADETGHRENGVNGYLWNFSTAAHQYLLYRQSRGKKIVKEALNLDEDGNGYNGVLVTDFYAAYNEHAGFHQRCWAHLLRDIHELKEKAKEENPQDKRTEIWAKKIRAVYDEANSYHGPDPNLPLGLQAQERINQERYFKEKLREVCLPYLTLEAPQSSLCGRIIKFLPELFTFIRFPDVPSTNNLAERALRHSVVQRKIFGGTRSKKGSETKAILGSLFGTWKLQGLNPLQQCRLLLARSPCP